MKVENQYIIHFKGLKEGVHDFNFVIDKPFFEFYEQLEVSDGHVEATIELNKKTSFMELVVELAGEMQVPCDRCLEPFTLPVTYNGILMVRFSETKKEQDEEVILIHPDEYELNLRHYLYECLSLSIPIRKVHPDLESGEPGCDPEMLRKLDEYLLK